MTLNVNKSELLEILRKAKSSHVRWRAYAQGLVAGAAVQEDNLPVRHTECRFGKWYFNEGTALFGELAVFRDIQGSHEMLHAIYAQVYDLVKEHDFKGAERKLDQLMEISRSLLEQLAYLEQDIEARA
jgi:hypothetical protein